MTDKEKIRAEIIKRRKAISKEEDDKRMKAVYGGIIFELTEILEFIDSLPVEPKFMVGQVVRSSNGTILKIIGIGQYCYHCDNGYSFGFDIQDEFELVGKSASDDLKEEDSFDELLQKLYIKYNKGVSIEKLLDIASNFVKWQKEKDRKGFELLKEWFEEIAERCSRLTSGNVSHNGKAIRGFARNCVEYIKTDLL